MAERINESIPTNGALLNNIKGAGKNMTAALGKMMEKNPQGSPENSKILDLNGLPPDFKDKFSKIEPIPNTSDINVQLKPGFQLLAGGVRYENVNINNLAKIIPGNVPNTFQLIKNDGKIVEVSIVPAIPKPQTPEPRQNQPQQAPAQNQGAPNLSFFNIAPTQNSGNSVSDAWTNTNNSMQRYSNILDNMPTVSRSWYTLSPEQQNLVAGAIGNMVVGVREKGEKIQSIRPTTNGGLEVISVPTRLSAKEYQIKTNLQTQVNNAYQQKNAPEFVRLSSEVSNFENQAMQAKIRYINAANWRQVY